MTGPASLTPQQAAATLAWLVDAGADALIADRPGNWLQAPATSLSPRPEKPAPGERPAPQDQPPPLPLQGGSPAPQTAPAAPLSARTLDELATEARGFASSLNAPNSAFVFADGNPRSKVMIVGEAPGQQEEREGKPFVGPAGQLLDRMLAAIGLDRTDEENGVYITNLSPWRPPRNRTPSPQEAAECLPLLHRHIAIHRPSLILCVGGTSAKALLGRDAGIMRLRGRWADVEIEGEGYRVMPTFHPAYLLRQPEQKRLAWIDLLALQSALRSLDQG